MWTVAGGPHYAGKPRPVAIIQHDRFDATNSITVCPFTTNPVDAPFIRLPVAPDGTNGLRLSCRLMIDKISTVPRAKLGARLGRLDAETVLRMNRAVFVFLGLAEPMRAVRRRRGRA